MCESEFREKASLETAIHQGRKTAGLINRETMTGRRSQMQAKLTGLGDVSPWAGAVLRAAEVTWKLQPLP